MSLQSTSDTSTGALSMDDAVSLLSTTREAAAPDPIEDDDEVDPEGEQDQEDLAGDQPAGEDEAPDEDPAGEDDAEDEVEEPAQPVVDPPAFWKAEEKALFATATPELQKVIATRDEEYGRQVSLAKEETAAARKEASAIGEVVAIVDKQLERAAEVFKGQWDGIDWARWAQEDPAGAFAAKVQFEQEQEELSRLTQLREATESEQHRQFLREQAGKLKELSPELADPKTGKAAKAELVQYLTDQGLTPQDLKWAGAVELTLARKAMLYDRAQANVAKNPPQVKPLTPKVKATSAGAVRPTATPSQGSQKRRVIESAQARFDKNPSQENALALMRAKRG